MLPIAGITLLAFCGVVWSARYNYKRAVVVFIIAFIIGCYRMLIYGYAMLGWQF